MKTSSSTYDRLEASTPEIDVAEINWWDAYVEESFCWLHTAAIQKPLFKSVFAATTYAPSSK
jgi:hypothetical protein